MLKTKPISKKQKSANTVPSPQLTFPVGIILAIIAALLFVGGAVLLVLQGNSTTKDIGPQGASNLQVSYRLDYLANDLYTQAQPGEKEARLLIYVKDIQFDLKYALQGLQGLPAQSVVTAQTQMVANASETSKYMDPDFIVWQKNEVLAPEETVQLSSSDSIERKYTLDVNKYFKYANDIYSKTQVSTVNELHLTFHITTTVQGPNGPIADNTEVTYTIPMLDNLLVVKGTPTAGNPISLNTTSATRSTSLLPYAILCFVLALGCGAYAAYRKIGKHQPDAESLYKKTVDKIFQQHGERLVRLENPLSYQQLATIPIDGIGEMVKIADEVSQPIFYYRVDTPSERKVEFYVFDSGRIYYMVMFGDMGKEPGLGQ